MNPADLASASAPSFNLVDLIFYAVAALTVACAAYAVFSRNIVRAVFSLLGTFLGVAGLYAMLAADFVAVVQLMVYVGGILVLMIFAVMLTSRIESASRSNPLGKPLNIVAGLLLGAVVASMLIGVALQAPWLQTGAATYAPTTAGLGEALLSVALLPFELLSVVLLGVVIGAVVVARRKDVGVDA